VGGGEEVVSDAVDDVVNPVARRVVGLVEPHK
jgi:hypothetical protein